ncbi:MAG: hypothetical protein ACRC54_01490 [Fusobacteriaceae bacterium]
MNKIEIKYFCKILEPRYLQNIYKIFLFSSLLELNDKRKDNKRIKIEELGVIMISKAWNLIFFTNLKLGNLDGIRKLCEKIEIKYNISRNESEFSLLNKLQEVIDKDEEIKVELNKIMQYPVPRLLTPFYLEELNGVLEQNRNKIINKLSKESDKALYKIFEENKEIEINKKWSNYLIHNKFIIELYIYNALIKFLYSKKNTSDEIELFINQMLLK